jgi:hypothetical protein
MRHKAVFGALVGAVLVLSAGCTSSTQEKNASKQENASQAGEGLRSSHQSRRVHHQGRQ